VILNVDDSCLGSPVRASYEGLIINILGFYLSDFSGFIRVLSAMMLAELYVVYRGLALAKNMVVQELVCSNSLLYIKYE
jgi:hypothetical protein